MGKLDQYENKRNFSNTKEPVSGSKKYRKKENIFVIQKHNASNLHYDFRLEAGGVLKSWAVPKGLSLDPNEKRLAVMVEDHPLEYADFEGIIPEGEYGAGQVIIWDKGIYENISEDREGENVNLEDALDRGLLEINLKGDKIIGGYALKRMGGKEKKQWLLIKKRDNYVDAKRNPTSTEPESVISGKTIEEI